VDNPDISGMYRFLLHDIKERPELSWSIFCTK
jgi:hypothetical protein